MNVGSDRIGVFCSLVSTKIPFKGTGKEYIGDDVTEIANAVKVRSAEIQMGNRWALPCVRFYFFLDR